jgi:HK97 family phage prohead protease
MPLPKPQPDESEDDFIARCMGDDVMQEYDKDQRLAICYSQWDKKENSMREIRGAIPKHDTGTSDAAWDGPANEANLKTDQDYDYYRKFYAWRDPEGDPANKSSYKLGHHEVSADGTPGAANIKGCQSVIGVLNGARGGADIPEDDRQGVWNHVAAHLKSADVEPAELKSLDSLWPPTKFSTEKHEREVRSFPMEIRVAEDENKITGYAAVFNKLSEDLGGFQEKVAKGAFAETIGTDDIRALFNHDPNYVLGRTTSGTLTMAEDNKGLAIEISPPDTTWARDLKESIKRGDVNQMSFAFVAQEEAWDNEKKIRTLKRVKLFDASVVTYPAYPQTSVKLRSLIEEMGEEEIIKRLTGSAEGTEAQPGTSQEAQAETQRKCRERRLKINSIGEKEK